MSESVGTSKSRFNNQIDMTTGSPTKNIVKFAIPILIGTLFQLAYSWTDGIVIGQYKGSNSFGAIAACQPAIALILLAVMGFLAGAAILLSQYCGAKRDEDFKKVNHNVMIVVIISSVVLMIVGYFSAKPLLQLIRVDAELLDEATQYFQIYFISILGMLLYTAFAQNLRAIGNSFVPLIILIICAGLNIVLDLVFVIVFDMSVAGVAWATSLSQFISAGLTFIYIQYRIPLVKFEKKYMKIDPETLKKILKVALPAMFQQLFFGLGNLLMGAFINNLGADFTTAFGLGNNIDNFASQLAFCFAIALSTYVAQNKGKNETTRIKQGLKSSIILSLGTLAVMAVFVLIFKDFLIWLFLGDKVVPGTDPKHIAELTLQFIYTLLPSYLILTISFNLQNLLRATGDYFFTMIIAFINLSTRVIVAYLLCYVFNMGFLGILLSMPISWTLAAILAFVRYKRGKWQTLDLMGKAKAVPA